jgi:hypothetical protein
MKPSWTKVVERVKERCAEKSAMPEAHQSQMTEAEWLQWMQERAARNRQRPNLKEWIEILADVLVRTPSLDIRERLIWLLELAQSPDEFFSLLALDRDELDRLYGTGIYARS